MKRVELLAPAGNYECLKAAVSAGADAVYLGGSKFGARAFADNFSEEELVDGIHYAHLFGVRIFLTVNTLVKEKEFGDLYDYLLPLYEAGLDGVIIQDLGVFHYLKKCFPKLELHASTQMTITGVRGAKLLKEMGASRIVPARELSLNEIRGISQQVDMDIECFIHGAMCYCYSGQCLFSSILGGRSGNRGRCAGPCRLPFKAEPSLTGQVYAHMSMSQPVAKGKPAQNDKNDKHANLDKNHKKLRNDKLNRNDKNKCNDSIARNDKNYRSDKWNRSEKNYHSDKANHNGNIDFGEQYPLSLKDMCTIEHVKDLIEAGITSFKIEGRMKSPEYVAGVTSVYRKAIDQYYDTLKAPVLSEDDYHLLNTLYIRSKRHDGYYYKHNGSEMITLSSPAYAGSDEMLVKKIHDTFLADHRRLMVDASFYCVVGEPMVLSLEAPSHQVSITVTGNCPQKAQNRAMGKEDFEKQLSKTKDTYFSISHFSVEIGNDVFVPVKEINSLRREALSKLMDAFVQKEEENRKDVICAERNCYESFETCIREKENSFLSVLVMNIEQLKAAVIESAVKRIYVDFELARVNKQEVLSLTEKVETYLVLPYVYRLRGEKLFQELATLLKEDGMDGVLVRSLDELLFLKETMIETKIQLDASLYVWNQESKSYLGSHNYGLTAPYELNKHELFDIGLQEMEVIVYGRIPMMITANCIYKTYGQCSPCNGYRKITTLKDRYGKEFMVSANCSNCYNVIYNSSVLSLHKQVSDLIAGQVDSIRVQLLDESYDETRNILKGYALAMKDEASEIDRLLPPFDYTNGHYKRGVD